MDSYKDRQTKIVVLLSDVLHMSIKEIIDAIPPEYQWDACFIEPYDTWYDENLIIQLVANKPESDEEYEERVKKYETIEAKKREKRQKQVMAKKEQEIALMNKLIAKYGKENN